MIKVNVRTNGGTKTAFAEVNTRIYDFLKNENVDLDGVNVMIKGRTLQASELNCDFATFGVQDGDMAVNLSAVVKMVAAFEVSFDKTNGNVLKVVTDISKEDIENKQMTYINEESNFTYAAVFDERTPLMTQDAFIGNTFVNGKLAFVTVLPHGVSEEDVKKCYGAAILAAKKYTEMMAENAKAEREEINRLFN